MNDIYRPNTLASFTGQPAITQSLSNILTAAKNRGEPARHVLFYGGPGLGKTTLSRIISEEMGSCRKEISADSIQSVQDLVAILVDIKPGDVLFVDEIHALPRKCEETLYLVMEDWVMDMIVDNEVRMSLRLPIPKFTVVGATTRLAKVNQPLRDRFGKSSTFALDYYSVATLSGIVMEAAKKLKIQLGAEAQKALAIRGRGTPRIALDLLKSARDYAEAQGVPISAKSVKLAAADIGIDDEGLDAMDRKYLETLIKRFGTGPAGVEAIASVMNLEPSTLDSVIEPWLLRQGFIERTPRGRVVTSSGLAHMVKG
jgi:holliday junction DNA helicase RuvB